MENGVKNSQTLRSRKKNNHRVIEKKYAADEWGMADAATKKSVQ
ncbi:hypothetical protein EMGBS15_11430 [Filimonas sp.]|jgi:hypothetical protein|nr:hypothetical protein EMGBS15_11430 [Filimonas sp.]